MPRIHCDICGAEFRKEKTFSDHLKKRSKCTNVSSLLSVLVKNRAIEVNNPDIEGKSPEISVNIETVKQEFQQNDQQLNFELSDDKYNGESFTDTESSVSDTGFQEVIVTSDGDIPLFNFDNSESESDGVDWDYLESQGKLDTVKNQRQVEESLKTETIKENTNHNSPAFNKNSAEVIKLRQRKGNLSGQSSIDLNEDEICHRKQKKRTGKRKKKEKRETSKTLVIVSESSSSSDDERYHPSKRLRSATSSKEKVEPVVKPVFYIESDSDSECDLKNASSSPKESPKHQPSTSNTVSLKVNDATEKEMPHEFSCGICKMSFSESNTLEAHIYTHNGIEEQQNLPEFICGICSKVFNCDDNLESHMMQHMNNALQETVESSDCDDDDTSRNETVKITDPEYICGKCHQSFTSTNSLHSHLKTHLNIISALTKTQKDVTQFTPKSNIMATDSTLSLIRTLLNTRNSDSTGSQDLRPTPAISDNTKDRPGDTKKLTKLLNYMYQE